MTCGTTLQKERQKKEQNECRMVRTEEKGNKKNGGTEEGGDLRPPPGSPLHCHGYWFTRLEASGEPRSEFLAN